MNLTEFNSQNSTKLRIGDPRIRFQFDGSITFNSFANDSIGIDLSKRVKLFQDKDSPKDWYIGFCSTKDGFKMRPNQKKGRSIVFNSKAVVMEIAKSLSIEAGWKSISVPIASSVEYNGVLYWPLITSSADLRR